VNASQGGWTSHGHAIPGIPQDEAQRPQMIARCGGPALCGRCADEVEQVIAAARDASDTLALDEARAYYAAPEVPVRTVWAEYGSCPDCGAGGGDRCVIVDGGPGSYRSTPHDSRPPVQPAGLPTVPQDMSAHGVPEVEQQPCDRTDMPYDAEVRCTDCGQAAYVHPNWKGPSPAEFEDTVAENRRRLEAERRRVRRVQEDRWAGGLLDDARRAADGVPLAVVEQAKAAPAIAAALGDLDHIRSVLTRHVTPDVEWAVADAALDRIEQALKGGQL
jgi:hypothetical protein